MVAILKFTETPMHCVVPQELTGLRSTVLQKQTHSWKKRSCLRLPEAEVREGGDQMRVVKRYKPAVIRHMQNGGKKLKKKPKFKRVSCPATSGPDKQESLPGPQVLAWDHQSFLMISSIL